MDLQRAKELLVVLADGINPLTGEVLPATDSCNQVDIVRALHTVLSNLDENKKERQVIKNAGKSWSTKEDEKLIAAYRDGISPSELAKIHKRSRGAITSRLSKLGEITK